MGATHKNSADPYKRNTLGWNSNTKKHGGQKRQVRCFLLGRGFSDDIEEMNKILRGFGIHMKTHTLSCKEIVDKHWEEFKNFVDINNNLSC